MGYDSVPNLQQTIGGSQLVLLDVWGDMGGCTTRTYISHILWQATVALS